MFVFAAVVTPPDVFSQVGLAVPLILLYEVSIWMVKMIERDRAKKEAAEKAAEEAEKRGAGKKGKEEKGKEEKESDSGEQD